MKKLFLFDIDGTLIQSNRVGSKAMTRTIEDFVGRSDGLVQVKMGGMCDWGIWREALAVEGYTREEVDAQIEDLFRQYLAELAHILASPDHPDPEPLPGIRSLLQALHEREDVLLGLLTGNVEAAAWLKLGKVGLDHYFQFGAFGSEAAERSALPAIALQKSQRLMPGSAFSGKEIVIIGDTVHDITCGAPLGVCAVGVATGNTDPEALHEAGADYVFDSFADYEAVLERLLPATDR